MFNLTLIEKNIRSFKFQREYLCAKKKNCLLKRPFPRQLWEVESDEFLFECHVQRCELSVPSRAQVSSGHVDIEHDVTLVFSLADVVIWHADRQRSFLAVIHRCVTDNTEYHQLFSNHLNNRFIQTIKTKEMQNLHLTVSPHVLAWLQSFRLLGRHGDHSQSEHVTARLDQIHHLFVCCTFYVHIVPINRKYFFLFLNHIFFLTNNKL